LELAAKILTDRPGIRERKLRVRLFHERFADQASFVGPPSVDRGLSGLGQRGDPFDGELGIANLIE
jgi:hypothetical protein